MPINIPYLATEMLAAAKPILQNHWSEIKDYAEIEFKKFLSAAANIEDLLLEGKINQERARILINFQLKSIENVFLTIEGLQLIAVQNAINAAVSVVKDTINSSIGFNLL